MDFLDKVEREKRLEIERSRERISETELEKKIKGAPGPRGFRRALEGGRAVIAEIKRASPSAGVINPGLDAAATAKMYEEVGARAVSVLTDAKHFSGSLADLEAARRACGLPLLRKDFIIDRYQMLEAVERGADAVLLIADMLGNSLGGRFKETKELGLDPLVEVHTEDEFKSAVDTGADLIGVNNRNLRTLEVDLGVTERLASKKPTGVVLVAASGVSSAEDARRMFEAGADAILVGTFLMRSSDPRASLISIVGT